MNRFLFSFILLISIFASCNYTLTKGKYIKGVVIYRAERNFPVGIIKIEDIHIKDIVTIDTSGYSYSPPMESPSRAVMYEFKDTLPLDLFTEVWFEIKEKGNYQYANKIQDVEPNSNLLMSDHEKYFLLNKIKFNLHNGDKHREGPKHTRIHVHTGGNLGYYSIQTSYPHIALLRYNEIETGLLDSVYVRSSDVPLDTTRAYFIQFDAIIDNFAVHSLDLNHIH